MRAQLQTSHVNPPTRGETVRSGAQLTAAVLLCASLGSSVMAQDQAPTVNPDADKEDWIQLFNGRNLEGWAPKITGHEYGENYADTYRVEDGAIKVRYDKYDSFDGRFGLLFYKQPYSYYRLRIEYRFSGEQMKGHPGAWATRNAGVMVHTQSGRSMFKDQTFPICVEAQFLGGLSDGKERQTLNMCSPGSEIVYEGRIYPEHCLSSKSKTYHGDQWVQGELLVLGSGQITHYVNGEEVLEYALPQIGGGQIDHYDQKLFQPGKLLDSGYIALQAESHPIDYRKVELLNLEGCMDKKALNYKSYFVKSNPNTCRYSGT
jgi:hypothetical protein